jgi:hypothetical protein
LDTKGKSLRPLFELHDTAKEGKVPLSIFKQIFRENSRGQGLDLWVSDLDLILAFLDPMGTEASQIDYSLFLFFLEK